MDLWKRWSGAYVAFAVTLFVYLLSRSLVYAALSCSLVLLPGLGVPSRDKKARADHAGHCRCHSLHHAPEFARLVVPAHADQLAPQWWSPVMPVSFFLSAIAAGTAVVILIEMWIAKAWKRQLRIAQLAAMGKITFWSLLVYLVFRLGDMALRGQFAHAFSGRLGALFAAEIVLGGILPLILLARTSQRPMKRALCRRVAHRAGRDLQSRERGVTGNEPERGYAADCARALLANDLRVGHLHWTDCGSNLPLWTRSAADATAATRRP